VHPRATPCHRDPFTMAGCNMGCAEVPIYLGHDVFSCRTEYIRIILPVIYILTIVYYINFDTP